PETALHVTGIGYYFAEFLQHAREVPVGIISCCWGATPAQAWMSESWLKRSPRLKPLWDAFTEHTAALDKNEYDREYDRYVEDMYRLIEERGDIAGKVRELGLDGYRRWVSAHPLVWPDQPYSHKSPERPCGLYETMLQTVAPYAIRGVLWYQGEANANRAEAVLYRELLTGLIANWREAWDSPELPFLIVQLSSFAWLGNPDGEIWPVI
ncbi:sialate O-acetylesterase, partial [Paenibacillus sepulcri]|nr:sialate O-acetylesterase [Paenibacillus sepulcri]